LATLAQVAGLSPHHFASSFTKATGLSPHQYLLRERIENSKLYLKDAKFSIAEVSRLTGFQTHEHFAKVFRKMVGVTPSEFRKSRLKR
jgi:AraC family transcriptional regulator